MGTRKTTLVVNTYSMPKNPQGSMLSLSHTHSTWTDSPLNPSLTPLPLTHSSSPHHHLFDSVLSSPTALGDKGQIKGPPPHAGVLRVETQMAAPVKGTSTHADTHTHIVTGILQSAVFH